MATLPRRALAAVGDSVRVNCANLAKVGIGITGTWVGTIQFLGSVDGLVFKPIYMTPFPPGTATLPTGVNAVTANGNWEYPGENYVAIVAQLTAWTSGAALVTGAASNDTSYQDAFQASTSNYVSQQVTGGLVNTVTIAGQANRAQRCRTAVVSFSAAPAAPVLVSIYDGGSSNVLWQEYAPAAAGSFKLNLPLDWNTPYTTGGGVVGSIGNSMQVTVAAPGGTVTSILDLEMIPA